MHASMTVLYDLSVVIVTLQFCAGLYLKYVQGEILEGF